MKHPARFLEEKKLTSIAALMVNGINPFRRILFFSVSVFMPFLALIFGIEKARELELFCTEDEFELLRRSLEREK